MELLIFVCWFVSYNFTKIVLTDLGVASSVFSMCKIILFANRECWSDFFEYSLVLSLFQYHSEQMSWERLSIAYSTSLKSFLFSSVSVMLPVDLSYFGSIILICMSSRHFIFLEFLLRNWTLSITFTISSFCFVLL